MTNLNPESYREMIQVLHDFIKKVSDACDEMELAGRTCVENLGDDETGIRANDQLVICIGKYRETLGMAKRVEDALQRQLGIIETANRIYSS